MAKKDKSDRIISLIRGARYVDVVARVNGKIQELRFIKDYSDNEIRDIVLGTKQIPSEAEGNEAPPADKDASANSPEHQTVPTPPVINKDRVTRQDMINALKAAGVVDIQANNRNALEKAYNDLIASKQQGGDE